MRTRLILFVCVALLAWAVPSMAATMRGLVTDSTGAPLPDARVVLRDVATGQESAGADRRRWPLSSSPRRHRHVPRARHAGVVRRGRPHGHARQRRRRGRRVGQPRTRIVRRARSASPPPAPNARSGRSRCTSRRSAPRPSSRPIRSRPVTRWRWPPNVTPGGQRSVRRAAAAARPRFDPHARAGRRRAAEHRPPGHRPHRRRSGPHPDRQHQPHRDRQRRRHAALRLGRAGRHREHRHQRADLHARTTQWIYGVNGYYSSNEDGRRGSVTIGATAPRYAVRIQGGAEDYDNYSAGKLDVEDTRPFFASGQIDRPTPSTTTSASPSTPFPIRSTRRTSAPTTRCPTRRPRATSSTPPASCSSATTAACASATSAAAWRTSASPTSPRRTSSTPPRCRTATSTRCRRATKRRRSRRGWPTCR